MKTYTLLKDLPDTEAGTKIIWNESTNAYYYIKKGAYVSPYDKNFLTAGQVTQSPEWFKEDEGLWKQPEVNQELSESEKAIFWANYGVG